MTHHSTVFEVERPLPVDATVKDLQPDTNDKPSAGELASPVVKKFNFRRLLMAGAAVAVVAGAIWYGWDYWTVGQYLVSTDDAYVKADNTTVAPKISGYLREVLVGDNEPVKTGQVLARIDERDFRVAGPGQIRCRRGQCRDREQAGPARRSAGRDRRRQGNHRGR